MNILKDINLKELSTFKVNEKAKYFADITTEGEIQELINTKEFKENKRYILGRGANTLFKEDFDGLVIKISIKGKEILSEDNTAVLLKVGAGEDWTELVEYTVNNGWSGIESLVLIPGTAGAAPVQNIGAYGQEISNVFEYLEAVNLSNGQKEIFNKTECNFGYRSSIFKEEDKGKYIITAIVIKLQKTDDNIYLSSFPQYKSLEAELQKNGNEPYTLRDIYNAVVNIRKKKLPSIEEYGSAGSFFTNPVITGEQLTKIQHTFPDIPYFETGSNNSFKIPTGWVLEQLGWKGKREGDVGTWPDHALIVVNYGDVSGKKVIAFTDKIADDFLKKTGIPLTPEVNII
jgi:UDP-N-acetylmuramate dehydrogenase